MTSIPITRFLNFVLLTFLLALSLTACTDGVDDRNAFLSTLRLTSIADEPDDNGDIVKVDLEVDLILEPVFDPRTKSYTLKANCVTDSVDVLAFPAYPGLNLTINGETPASSVTPVNIVTPAGINTITNVAIFLSGDSYIETTYDLVITRGDPNDPPAIKLSGGLIVNHTLGAGYNDAGYFACDTTGTDLTTIVNIAGDSVLISKLGTYLVTYDVSDNNGPATQVIRTVNVVTNTAPFITLIGSSFITVTQDSEYIDDGATAQDAQEGDLTSKININNPVDTSMIATYEITYDVTDLDGEGLSATQVIRTITVVAP